MGMTFMMMMMIFYDNYDYFIMMIICMMMMKIFMKMAMHFLTGSLMWSAVREINLGLLFIHSINSWPFCSFFVFACFSRFFTQRFSYVSIVNFPCCDCISIKAHFQCQLLFQTLKSDGYDERT